MGGRWCGTARQLRMLAPQDIQRLGDTSNFKLFVCVDRVRFATKYEASVLSLDKLTPHQRASLQQCRASPYVHLAAPAGAGKTFVALNRIREVPTARLPYVVATTP